MKLTQRKSAVVLSVLFLLVLGFACSKTENRRESAGSGEKASTDSRVKTFLSRETLEAVGFEHFGDYNFRLLFKCGYLYVLNNRDFMIVKFRGAEPQKVYKTSKGQAPYEMIHPITIFGYNADTIAVFDKTRRCVLRFDLDLNVIDEIKLTYDYNFIYGCCQGLIAFLNYKHLHAFAFPDQNFKPVETFIKANKTIPFERFYPQLLNKRYILSPDLVAHTYNLYPRKTCRVNIYDLNTKALKVSLTWEQPFSPNQKDISARKNLYFSLYTGKHGPFYVVQSSIVKSLGRREKYHFLVFNLKGELILDEKIPYRFISVQTDTEDSMVYFLDENENISTIDIAKLIEKKISK